MTDVVRIARERQALLSREIAELNEFILLAEHLAGQVTAEDLEPVKPVIEPDKRT